MLHSYCSLDRGKGSGGWGKGGDSYGNESSGEIKKIFVGGLSNTVEDAAFRQYFETFGAVTDAVVMLDRETNRSRGFGFITFESAVRLRHYRCLPRCCC